jgi:hypothetical protein
MKYRLAKSSYCKKFSFHSDTDHCIAMFVGAALFVLTASVFAVQGFTVNLDVILNPLALKLPSSFCIGDRKPSFSFQQAFTAQEATAPEVQEELWLKPALHNTPAFRSASLLTALWLAWYSTSTAANPLAALSAKAAKTIHFLAYGTWLGSAFYVTCIARFALWKNLPRQTFGKMQSKLFPAYFSLSALTILLQVSCHKNSRGQHFPLSCPFMIPCKPFFKISSLCFDYHQLVTLPEIPSLMAVHVKKALGSALALTLLNIVYLGPVTTRIMFERFDLDNTPSGRASEKYRELASSFGILHGLSSLANLIAFCAAVAHGFFLASAVA